MKSLLATLIVTLLSWVPWNHTQAHPGGNDSLSPAQQQAHAELLAETRLLITTTAPASQSPRSEARATNKKGVKAQAKEAQANQLEADETRVTVLGYHDFSDTKKATEMLISTEKFRKQMQAIKDLGLNVINLDDFIAWKQGEKKIKDKSVLITIDDGWKSVYIDAYPILKEFGYPFTVFLYTNYVDGGGRALTTPMIQEMLKHGCSIGSHSISHPYPAKIKAERDKGTKAFDQYLRQEMGDSKKSLELQFKQKIITYAYPGGYVTDEMLPIATECGYQCLFTVIPNKVTQSSSAMTLPRYVILGTHDYIFRNATSFKANGTSDASEGAIVQLTPHPVTPCPGSAATDRLPTITADLSKVENLDPESIIMRVSGFGKVKARYDPSTKVISWKVTRKLRASTCEASVQWQLIDQAKYQKPMTWIFKINRKAAYQPQGLHHQ